MLLETKKVTKIFGGLHANSDIDFYGSMITEATKCDLAIATEKGNIVVKNGDGLNEIDL